MHHKPTLLSDAAVAPGSSEQRCSQRFLTAIRILCTAVIPSNAADARVSTNSGEASFALDSSPFEGTRSSPTNLMQKYAASVVLLLLLVVTCSVPWANCKSLEGYEAEEQTEMTEAPDAADTGNFRLSTVNEHLVKSITESGDDILLDHYLGAFREICKIFREMGTVFNFVTSDLEDKIRILEEYRSHNDIGEY